MLKLAVYGLAVSQDYSFRYVEATPQLGVQGRDRILEGARP